MTNRQKIAVVKKAKKHWREIASILGKIIHDTFDYRCTNVIDYQVRDKEIYVNYAWSNMMNGCSSHDYAYIPIKWLDEGFDYKAAFEEECRKAEEKRKQEELEEQKQKEEAEKKAAKHKEQQEHELYLKLKKKYEGGAK